MIYKINLNETSKWTPSGIYIGRTTQGKIRFSQHKTRIRHTLDIFLGVGKYKINERIFDGYLDLIERGLFRFRAGSDFKMGIELLLKGAKLEDVLGKNIEKYLTIDYIENDFKRDVNGVSVSEYKNINSNEASRLGFNGVGSYEFESGGSLIKGEVSNINFVVECDELEKNSIWFNNYGFSSLLDFEELVWYSPETAVIMLNLLHEKYDGIEVCYEKLKNKLIAYNFDFYNALNKNIKAKINLKRIEKIYNETYEYLSSISKNWKCNFASSISLSGKIRNLKHILENSNEENYESIKDEILQLRFKLRKMLN